MIIKKSKNTTYYVFIVGIFFLIISPMWLTKGMFLDGIYYASIARNLSLGDGSFWDLFYTKYLDSHFMSHPPLVFWIEGYLFKLFGDTIYVEKIYSVFTFIISGMLSIVLWNIFVEKTDKKYSWLPILFLTIIPITSWAAVNNLLENTMMIFDLVAVIFVFKSIKSKRFLYVFFAGVFVFLAALSKGLVALFPLSSFFWIWLIQKEISFKRMFIDSLFFIAISFGIFFLIVALNEKALLFFEIYFNKQILSSIGNAKSQSEFYNILIWTIEQLAILIGVVFLVFLLGRKKLNDRFIKTDYKKALVIVLIALSGVLPIMISSKQRPFYLIPTFPLFAVGFAVFVRHIIALWITIFEKKAVLFKVFQYFSILIFIVAIIANISQIGHQNRDKELQKDVCRIAEIVGENSQLTISREIYNNWSMHGYFMRYHRISLSIDKEFDYKIISVSDTNSYQNYSPLNIELNLYVLLKHIE